MKFDRISARYLLALIVLINLGLTIGTIRRRQPEVDEALFANPAYNLATKGTFGTDIIDTVELAKTGLNKVTYWTVPLHLVALAGWFKVFGFSIWSQRYLSAFWGVIAILAWYVIIEALSRDYRLAVFTATLIGLDHALVASASLGRMDMMSAALSYAALAAYLALRERRLPLAFLAAFSAVAASGLSHPAGGVLSFCGVSLLAIYLDRRRVSVYCLTLAAIPFVIAAIGWGLFILRHPDYFLSQFGFNITGVGIR